MVKAVFIDFDGTLADSMGVCEKVYETFCQNHGVEPSHEEFSELVGPSIHEVVAILKSRHNLEKEGLLEEYHALLEDLIPKEAYLFPTARLFLFKAKEQGLPLYLVTSTHSRLIEEFLRLHDLGKYFAGVITADGLEHSKPHPDIYQKALEVSGYAPEEVVAIEDSINGIRSAVAAGIPAWCYGPHELPPAGSYLVVHSWCEIAYALLDLTWDLEPISPDFTVQMVEPVKRDCPTEVERIWQEEKKRRGDAIYNGQVLSVIERDVNGLWARSEEYKWLLAQHRRPELRQAIGITPIGVTGVTRYGDEILLGRRSDEVTHYPGMWEVAPSGSLDPTEDYIAHLLSEMEEEVGIGAALVKSSQPRFLFYDPLLQVLDLVVEFWLTEKAEVRGNGEYSETAWVKLEDLPRFIDEAVGHIAPPTQFLLAQLP